MCCYCCLCRCMRMSWRCIFQIVINCMLDIQFFHCSVACLLSEWCTSYHFTCTVHYFTWSKTNPKHTRDQRIWKYCRFECLRGFFRRCSGWWCCCACWLPFYRHLFYTITNTYRYLRNATSNNKTLNTLRLSTGFIYGLR